MIFAMCARSRSQRVSSRLVSLVTSALACVLAASSAAQQSGAARPFDVRRLEMVEHQVRQRGISEPGVLQALRDVPRHDFVPEIWRERAYEDQPIEIGSGQTISQPYLVALMTHLLELDGSERILEVGTGSGYHAAVLSRLAKEVYTIEIRDELAEQARETLERLGYDNVRIRVGDGYAGWPEEAPFDAIVLTTAPKKIPPPLIEQLRLGGLMVAPVGGFVQDLQVLRKTETGLQKRNVEVVRFLEMTGRAQEPPR